MPIVNLSPAPILRFTYDDGSPLAAGTLTTQVGGVNFPTWSDSAGVSQLPNPIVLNARGEVATNTGASCPLWIQPGYAYTYILRDVDGNLIWTAPNIAGIQTLLTSASIGAILYPQTTQESTAGVTPTIYVPTLQIDLERYGGGVGYSAAANNAALVSVIAVIRQKGGGTLVSRGSGIYTFSAAASLPTGMVIQGDGGDTVWKYTGSGAFLTVPSAGGRVTMREFGITGTSLAGQGITLGDAAGQAAKCDFRKLVMSGWDTALRIGGATWLDCVDCEFGNASGGLGSITNNIGVDYNNFVASANANNYNSAHSFVRCIVSNNANAGVAATRNYPVMNGIAFRDCNVQNNCQSTLANPQFYMGQVSGFSIDNIYMEYKLGGAAPTAMRTDGMTGGRIDDAYIDTADYGMRDYGGGSMSQVEINRPEFLSMTTAAISMASETDVIVRTPTSLGGGSVTVTGSGCTYLPTGSGLASWPNNKATWVPTLIGTGGVAPTYTTHIGVYSRYGNTINFKGRIQVTAIGVTGPVSVAGLPIAATNDQPAVGDPVAIYLSGWTPAGGATQVIGRIAANATTIQLYGQGIVAPAQIDAAALAAATVIEFSGTYDV